MAVHEGESAIRQVIVTRFSNAAAAPGKGSPIERRSARWATGLRVSGPFVISLITFASDSVIEGHCAEIRSRVAYDLEKMLVEGWNENELKKLDPDNIDVTQRQARVSASSSSKSGAE
jgi:hypothetical protein